MICSLVGEIVPDYKRFQFSICNGRGIKEYLLPDSKRFQFSICNGRGMQTENAFLFRTPVPVQFGTCSCSHVETSLSETCNMS